MAANVISASLWGDNPKYTVGAVRNAELWPQFYPDWKFRIYHDDSVPEETLRELSSRGVELVKKERLDSFHGMFWRFEVNDDPTVDRFIVRDLDSRFSVREKFCVDQWLASGQPFHAMRDHPHHTVAIMGGMWGGTTGYFQIKPIIDSWKRYGQYGIDQEMLERKFWPLIKNLCHVNDTRRDPNAEVPRNEEGTHIGQIFEADGTPVWR